MLQFSVLITQKFDNRKSTRYNLTPCVVLSHPCRLKEKRPSGGGSFSSFQIPTQRDPGLRLRQMSDDESKENVDSSAACDGERRLSQASNGDMETL